MVKKEIVVSEVEGGYIIRASILTPAGVQQNVYSVPKVSKVIKIIKEALNAPTPVLEVIPAEAVDEAPAVESGK